MRNDNCLRGVACPKCGSTDRFDIAVHAVATMIDNGAEDYVEPTWDDTAQTTCDSCGHTGVFHEFQSQHTLSDCLLCGVQIRWTGLDWVDNDGLGQCASGEDHRSKVLTLGELRDRTAHLPDYVPVVAAVENYTNDLHLDVVPKVDELTAWPTLILSQTDDQGNGQ